MADNSLAALESKLDQLLLQCQRLSEENASLQKRATRLQEREDNWLAERSMLIEKNDLARSRIEAMISRLKSLEEQT